MIKCPNCGVELDDNVNFCSLCGEPLLAKNEDNLAYLKKRKSEQDDKMMSDYQRLTGFQKRKIAWQISWIILLTGMVISLIIDLADNQRISWSIYPLTVSVVIFINITVILRLYRKLVLLLFLSFLSTASLLIALDIFAGRTGWGMRLGIPLLLAAYLTVYLLIFAIRKSRQKGLNIIAYIIMAAGVMSVCTDGIISVYKGGALNFGWGLIVLASTVGISVLLFYIQFRLKKVTDLKRFFHI
ncbi:MAG TPA: DUF6320 domain-containing protein [Bacteroidales bacterium]|nr:DUF6320 domain-containing protein [Bacteroidales bacterium]